MTVRPASAPHFIVAGLGGTGGCMYMYPQPECRDCNPKVRTNVEMRLKECGMYFRSGIYTKLLNVVWLGSSDHFQLRLIIDLHGWVMVHVPWVYLQGKFKEVALVRLLRLGITLNR